MSVGTEAVLSGTVTTWDDPRGIGEITADDGTVYGFHCTAIADGSRQTEVGAEVHFVVRPARLGRWEAAGITPA